MLRTTQILLFSLLGSVFFYIEPVYSNDIFRSLTINEGLAHTDANCVAQDSTGLIWIGTNSGLQKFDGYQFYTIDYYPLGQKIYESHNRVKVMECSRSHLWIGSDSGLTCLDLNTHQYVPYTVIGDDSEILHERILQLSIDNANQRLWILTQSKLCIARIEESTNTLHILDWVNEDDPSILWIYSKPVLRHGQGWVIADDKLFQISSNNGKMETIRSYKLADIIGYHVTSRFLFATDDCLYIRSSQGCYKIPFTVDGLDTRQVVFLNFHETDTIIPQYTSGVFIVDKEGTLWCTYFGGLFKVASPFTENASVYVYLDNDKNINFSQSRIVSLFIDTYDNLWVPTMNRGLYYCSLKTSPFQYISKQKLLDVGFSRYDVNAIVTQDNVALWMIMEGGSLLRYDMEKGIVERIPLSVTKGAEDGLQTLSLSLDQKRLYIGLAQGVIVYEINTGKNYWLIGKDSKIIPKVYISVSKIVEDGLGRLWIASWGEGVYCVKDPHTAHASIVCHLNVREKYSLASTLISDLYMEENAVLVCTTNGLNKVWLDNKGEIRHISTYRTNINSGQSMSSDYLACIDQQNDSVYWIGTIGGGLNQVILHSEKDNDYSAAVYTKNDGLTSNDCEIVFLDHEQNVWIGGNGITCFMPNTKRVSVYEPVDGLQSNSFKIGAGYKSTDGTIYMGSIDGLNFFNPKDFINNSYPVSLNFGDLYVNNKVVTPQEEYDGKVILPAVLNKTEHIKLTYKQNNFIISFSALGYNFSDRIMYRYRMIGYDNKWQVVPHFTNKAFYSNLPYGDYQFELQVSTDHGYSWLLQERSFKLSMLPPWWWTGWAKLSYLIIAILIITIIVYQYNKEQRLKRENHIQELKRINEEEKYQTKMRFFMNISHELKTPLTLIMLAAERMAELNLTKECKTILANSRKMLSLITELVDIRKADLGINQLSLSFQSMSELVSQLYTELEPWAEKKNIAINYESEEEDIKMDFDLDKIGKLVINLISNAIKYTPKGGAINLSLRKGIMRDIVPLYSTTYQEGEVALEQPVCIFTIRDNGVGISPESIRSIYERFFQVKDINLTHLGSGIGLAIAKNMVLLHKGCMIVSSERSVGTEFIVALPIAKESTTPAADFSSFDTKEFINSQYLEYIPSEDTVAEEQQSDMEYIPGEDYPTVLIVEDNKELQRVLIERLSSHYHVEIADNGKVGLEKCETLYPDIIISDVMMPEMDGIEMCKRIRENLSVAYIPIILLTAKGGDDNQIKGYESGADLYIPKPFSIKLLEVNIKRLLAQKERWLKQEQAPSINKKEKPEEMNTFENRLKQLIEDNMGNPDFSIDFICNNLGLGRTKLYAKLKELGEQPLADYIRNARLEKAVHLLKHSDMNINEVMFTVGFVNNSHFSKTFRQKYGISPSDYKKQCMSS